MLQNRHVRVHDHSTCTITLPSPALLLDMQSLERVVQVALTIRESPRCVVKCGMGSWVRKIHHNAQKWTLVEQIRRLQSRCWGVRGQDMQCILSHNLPTITSLNWATPTCRDIADTSISAGDLVFVHQTLLQLPAGFLILRIPSGLEEHERALHHLRS